MFLGSVRPRLNEPFSPSLCPLPSVWPDWAIYGTLGKFLKPLATGCKGVKTYHFSIELIFGQLLQRFGDFFWSHCLPSPHYHYFVQVFRRVPKSGFRGCFTSDDNFDCFNDVVAFGKELLWFGATPASGTVILARRRQDLKTRFVTLTLIQAEVSSLRQLPRLNCYLNSSHIMANLGLVLVNFHSFCASFK